MSILKILGLLIIISLLSSCRFPHKLTEVNSEERNVEVWTSGNSSIKVAGKLRFLHPPGTLHNRAGWIEFKIISQNPDQKLKLHSEEIKLYWLSTNSDLVIPIPIEESTISNSHLQNSIRSRFTVSGTITMEIWERMFDLDYSPDTGRFKLEFPQVIYENDTISLPPIKFYKKPHWLYLNQD